MTAKQISMPTIVRRVRYFLAKRQERLVVVDRTLGIFNIADKDGTVVTTDVNLEATARVLGAFLPGEVLNNAIETTESVAQPVIEAAPAKPKKAKRGRKVALACLECGKTFKGCTSDPKCPKCGGVDVEVADAPARKGKRVKKGARS